MISTADCNYADSMKNSQANAQSNKEDDGSQCVDKEVVIGDKGGRPKECCSSNLSLFQEITSGGGNPTLDFEAR